MVALLSCVVAVVLLLCKMRTHPSPEALLCQPKKTYGTHWRGELTNGNDSGWKGTGGQCKQEVKKQRKPWPEDLAWR